MQFFCDVEKPDGAPLAATAAAFCASVNRKFQKAGHHLQRGRRV